MSKSVHRKSLTIVAGAMVASLALLPGAGAEKKSSGATPPQRGTVDKLIGDWSARPRVAALEMIEKYGLPQEATSETLVWRDAGPFKRVMVTRAEIPHDFPRPHMDYLEHTLAYDVPASKLDDLAAFDGSITVNRTAGELSARCDLEPHNLLTLNLAHEVITGKKSSAQARKAFGDILIAATLGERPGHVEKLLFEPAGKATGFADKPTIPGAPVRVIEAGAPPKSGVDADAARNAEILATLIAIDDNEIHAGDVAARKNIVEKVQDYGRLMHTHHGKHLVDTTRLAVSLKTRPTDTDAVEQVRVKGAAELATLLPLDGRAFEVAFLDAMVKGHAEVLAMLDAELLTGVKAPGLRKHLEESRRTVAAHLDEAKKLRAGY